MENGFGKVNVKDRPNPGNGVKYNTWYNEEKPLFL